MCSSSLKILLIQILWWKSTMTLFITMWQICFGVIAFFNSHGKETFSTHTFLGKSSCCPTGDPKKSHTKPLVRWNFEVGDFFLVLSCFRSRLFKRIFCWVKVESWKAMLIDPSMQQLRWKHCDSRMQWWISRLSVCFCRSLVWLKKLDQSRCRKWSSHPQRFLFGCEMRNFLKPDEGRLGRLGWPVMIFGDWLGYGSCLLPMPSILPSMSGT